MAAPTRPIARNNWHAPREIPIACKDGTDHVSGFCLDPEDMPRTTPSYPTAEAAPGPRTIVVIHGAGGDALSWFRGNDPTDILYPEVLHDPAYGFNLLIVDYNASNDEPGAPFRIFASLDTYEREVLGAREAQG